MSSSAVAAVPASRRWPWWLAAGALLTVALGIALVRLAAEKLHAAIGSALGPRATLEATELRWNGVELRGLRIAAARGWPAADELRAARVHVVPDLRSLWSVARGGAWRIARIEVEGGYLSLLRTRDGSLRLLPALLDGGAKGAAGPPLTIASVRLRAAAIDLHDASLRPGAPHRVRLQALDADVGPLQLPALDRAIDVELSAVLKGPRHDGRLALTGQLTPASRDAALRLRARGVDLIALQPYLLKGNDGSVTSGRLDLDLDAQVQRMRLHAPGRLKLTDLELASGSGVLGTLAGAPRQAVLAALRRDGRIEVGFTLEGRLDDPAFSLNENLLTRVTSGLAESLGVSIGGVVEGVGSVIKGLFGR